jgi:hypothetical protein
MLLNACDRGGGNASWCGRGKAHPYIGNVIIILIDILGPGPGLYS